MKVGIIGLGKMGRAIAYRLEQAGHTIFGFDVNKQACKEVENSSIICLSSYKELAQSVDIIWLMIPAGIIIDTVLEILQPDIQKKTIIVDGGNSKFSDSIKRAEKLQKNGISFLDCGTSGGLQAQELGFSLMIGGNHQAFKWAESVFKAIAAPGGYGYMGPSGAGHYVKMIHNGIEYALLQAYAEGFHLLKEGRYKNLDLALIAQVWLHGSVIRSWILELAHKILQHDQEFKNILGEIGGGSTGQWAVDAAHESKIPVPLIAESLEIRKESRKTGGNFATKFVALLREQFGGHEVKKQNDD